jgi:3-oxoadipate enol-lactonase
VPTLVVVGEEDSLTPPASAEVIAQAVARARLVRIPAAGHLSNLEAPEAFNRAVREFLLQE